MNTKNLIDKYMVDIGGADGAGPVKIDYEAVDEVCTNVSRIVGEISNLCEKNLSDVNDYQGDAKVAIDSFIANVKSDINKASEKKLEKIEDDLGKVKQAYKDYDARIKARFEKMGSDSQTANYTN